ncbi:MAG: HAMP domain-containing sensor histidine kinase [Dermatophilus congolensis]|nr:HAMP domain-containing sensor histidine kinase [Dermatophilus congolensis]
MGEPRPSAQEVPRAARPRARSLRDRLLLTVLTLAAAALVVSGFASYTVESARVESHAVETLRVQARDFAALAQQPLAPTEADRVDRIFELALQRPVAASEGGFALIGDTVAWIGPEGWPVRPEDDPGFVEAMLRQAASATSAEGRYTADGTDYAWIVMPVQAPGVERAALVRVVDLGIEKRALNSRFVTTALTGLGALLLVGAVTGFVVTRALEPIAWLRDTAAGIDEHDLSARVPVRGSDDLADLTRTMNGMLDRIEKAVTDQRQLCRDVGHELRTPITIARGHLEIMDPADAADSEAARAVTLKELARMTTLAEDLLLIASTDRDDFVVPSATDVAEVTQEVYDHAQVLGERTWVLEEAAMVVARLDPARIVQAWEQLASNAVKYSQTGTRVGIGSRKEGAELRLWVRDEGVGIAPENHARVLERFTRVSSVVGGKRPAGTGLGLAVVAAIARAHGGRVEIDSDLGRGALVSIVVPVGASATEGPELPSEPDVFEEET